jgi:hypothetical protein
MLISATTIKPPLFSANPLKAAAQRPRAKSATQVVRISPRFGAMDHVTDHARDASGHWLPGQSPNPQGRPTKSQLRAQHTAKAAEIASRWGGLDALDVIERERVTLAAGLLLRAKRPRSQEDEVRLINSADRLLARVERSQRARRRQGLSFAEALAGRKAKP